MKIVTVGLGDQQEAALSMLVAKILSGWQIESVDALSELPTSGGRVGVVDLPALGLLRYSKSHADAILNALVDMPIILLVTLHDHTWSEWLASKPDIDSIYLLRKPYKALDMQLALERQTSKKVQPIVAALASPAEAILADVGQLSIEEFVSMVIQREADAPSLFLRTIADTLKSGQSFEMRLTIQHYILVCPEERWVATNTPAAIIQRLVQSDGLTSVVKVRNIESAAGLQMAQRLKMEFQPADIFLWELLYPAENRPSSTLQPP